MHPFWRVIGLKAQWGLDEYLEHVYFKTGKTTVAPNPADVAGFDTFMKRYVAGLPVVQTAVEHLAEQNKTDFGGDYEKIDQYAFWFIVGSQDLYGAEVMPRLRITPKK